MSTPTFAYALAHAQDWTNTTLLDLALTYIDRQDDQPTFSDYLMAVASEENGCDDPALNIT